MCPVLGLEVLRLFQNDVKNLKWHLAELHDRYLSKLRRFVFRPQQVSSSCV